MTNRDRKIGLSEAITPSLASLCPMPRQKAPTKSSSDRIAVLSIGGDSIGSQHADGRYVPLLKQQFDALHDAGFQFRSLYSAMERVRREEPIAERTLAVTLESEHAQPDSRLIRELISLNVSVTVLFDAAQLAAMSPQDHDAWHRWALTGLVDFGVQPIAQGDSKPHSLEFYREMSTGVESLESIFAVTQPVLVFPVNSGIWGSEYEEIAMAVGAVACITNQQQSVDLRSNPFVWGRFQMAASDSPRAIVKRLSRQYSRWHRLWNQISEPFRATPIQAPTLVAQGM